MRFLSALILLALLCLPVSQSLATPAAPSAEWVSAEEQLQGLPPQTPLVFYQGNINVDVAKQTTKYEPKGLKPKPFEDRHVTLMFKVFGALPDPAFMLRTYAHRAARWSKYKAVIDGIQIDFDATDSDFDSFTSFILETKTALVNVPLSITGPLDWLTKVDATKLKILSGTVDYISFDLYQGGSPLPELASYPTQFRSISFPFKVGLIKSYDSPELLQAFAQNPNFRGAILYPGIQKDDE